MLSTEIAAFFDHLRNGHLLTPEQLADAICLGEAAGAAATAAGIAQQLVERRLITPWHAQMLLAGRHAFFIGKYKLLEQLGQGGMGTVYKAEQVPLGRTVALKVMAPGLVTDSAAVARFHREIRAAAALDHPHIVAAYDAESVQNTHFLVMEYVAGQDLGKWIHQVGRLPIAWSCECIRQAALGLQHACECGVVHRDIKPANLLVTQAPGVPGPFVKILDMGLARFANPANTEGSLTHTGVVMGTVDYIAPEQAIDARTADIRSDIFSLGCTLFRMLAGRLAFPGENVIERLTARGATVAPRVRGLRPEVPPALDAVLAKMLTRDPGQRYQTPLEVSLALAPFAETPVSNNSSAVSVTEPGSASVPKIAHEIHPAPDKTFEKPDMSFLDASPLSATLDLEAAEIRDSGPIFRKLAQRRDPSTTVEQEIGRSIHRPIGRRRSIMRAVALSGAGAVVVLLCGHAMWNALGKSTLIIDWAPEERRDAQLELDGRAMSVKKASVLRFPCQAGTHRLRMTRRGFEPVEFTITLGRGDVKTVDASWKPTLQTQSRRQWAALDRKVRQALRGLGPQLDTKGSREAFALVEELNAFRVRWVGTKESARAATLVGRLPSPLDQLSMSNVPVAQRDSWQPAELVAILGDPGPCHAGSVFCTACRPDGKQVASASGDGLIRLWDASTMHLQAEIRDVNHCLVYLPDNRTLVAGGSAVRFYDLSGAEPRCRLEIQGLTGTVRGIVLAPDRKTLALCGDQVRLWDVSSESPREILSFAPFDSAWGEAAFSPDCRMLVTWSNDKTIKLWNLNLDQPSLAPVLRAELKPHGPPQDGDYICGVTFSADGRRMYSCGVWDWNLITWDLTATTPRQMQTARSNHAITAMARSPDGHWLALGLWNGEIMIFDAAREPLGLAADLPTHDSQVWGLAFSPDNRRLVSGATDGRVRLAELAGTTWQEHSLTRAGHDRVVSGVAFSPNGAWLASSSYDKQTILWDTANGKALRQFPHEQPVLSLAVSLDGQTLATGEMNNGGITLRDVATGKIRQTLRGIDWPDQIAYSPNGTLIAAPHGTTVKLWNTATGAEVTSVGIFRRNVCRLAFFPDGDTLLAADTTPEFAPMQPIDLRTWDVATGKERFQFAAAEAPSLCDALAISPDGKSLAIATGSPLLTFWDAQRHAERSSVKIEPRVAYMTYSPDGSVLALLGKNMEVSLRDAQSGFELKSWNLPGLPRALAISPDGRHLALGNANGTVLILRLENRSTEADLPEGNDL